MDKNIQLITSANKVFAQLRADSYILSIISLPIFSHRLDRILIGFVVIRKFRSFNQQHHRADTASNSQTAAMLDVMAPCFEPLNDCSYLEMRIKHISLHKNQKFEIAEDRPEVGFYLFVYDENNICIADYLQNTEILAKEFAFEEFQVPLNSWSENKFVT